MAARPRRGTVTMRCWAGRRARRRTAFDLANRTIDVRRIAPPGARGADPDPRRSTSRCTGRAGPTSPTWRFTCGGGRVGVPNDRRPAFVAGGGRYRFSPLGHDMPLFSQPSARDAFTA